MATRSRPPPQQAPSPRASRRAWTTAGIALSACVVLAGVGLLRASTSTGAGLQPLSPEEDARILEKVPVLSAQERARVAALRKGEGPANLEAALELARGHVRRARQRSDPRFLGYAQAALGDWWHSASPPPEVRVLRAIIRQSNHDFTAALEDLARALEERPDDAQAWLTQSSLQLVRGELGAARRSCEPLARLSSPLVATACVAAVDGTGGRAQEAYAALSTAFARSGGREPSMNAWTLTLLGELAARRGEVAAAERHFRTALLLGEPDAYLLGALADLLLDAGRPAEVVSLLGAHVEADPLLLRLALAEKALGLPAGAEHAAELARRFGASRERGDSIHLREEARAALHLAQDAEGALRLALENWKVQREPADARLVLEAARAARRPEEARAVLAWLSETRLEDVHLAALASELKGGAR